MSVSKFSPGVIINGETINPPGWTYVLAFALRGIPWAMEAAEKPGFREQVKEYLREKKRVELEGEIDRRLVEIAELRRELSGA